MYEFFGEDGSGKTEMLLNLIVACTLPKVWKGIPMRGAEAKVVFISTDYKFSILRLVFIMEQKIRKILSNANHNSESSGPGEPTALSVQEKSLINSEQLETEVESLVQECLQRLQVVYCNSSQQLFVTLHYLESQFVTNPAFSLLIIDPISTFYWVDKFISNENTNQQGANIRRVTEILKKFQNFGIIIIATKSAIFKPKLPFPETDTHVFSSMPHMSRKPHFQYLDSLWENFITKRFIFLKPTPSALSSPPKFSIQQPQSRSVEFMITENGIEFL